MSTSKTSYKELSIPYFKEVFEIIDEVMIQMEVPYYLIGVNAIALELLKEGIKPGRGTKDIDFAMMLSSIAAYEEIVDQLVDRGFNRVKAPWTLFHEQYNVAIDILPFGEIEENDTISFNKRNANLHILGFKEVLEDAKTVQVENIEVKVPPLPGMVLLKLVAWGDRPEERDNDLSDILRIIQHYEDLEWNDIVEKHFDLLDNEPYDNLKIAARVLGRNARKFLAKSQKLASRIDKVLKENLADDEKSKIAKIWARQKNWEVKYAAEILLEFEQGLKDTV